MITLSAERLQKQSLEELKCTSFNLSLPLPDHTDMAHCGSPLQLAPERASWQDLISCPRIHLQDSTGFNCHHSHLNLAPCRQDNCSQKNSLTSQTLATDPLTLGKASTPPTKRHCCSPSVPKDLSHWQPLWRPLGSKVWTPIKHQDSSGERALEEQPLIPVHGACSFRFDQAPGTSLQCVQSGGGSSPPFFSLALSRASPVSMLWESGKTLQPFPLQRRFSLSPVLFLPSPRSSASSTPELLRRQHGLPRSQSQPCDLDTKKSGLKRRHDEDVRWHRPSLNFYKMNQRFSGGLCFLDKTEESSASSWILACSQQAPSAPCSPLSSYGPVLSEEEEARSQSWHMGSERTFFQQDFSDLDLNLIEEN
ncbi:protein FAM53C isoform X2 [Emydura macquarii macquarii]|uniref:protein FAM53C isoform X2 n=1 Tax=Emydura macquarii macquarii TaxID=1129001 RepID=UPI00352B737B